MEPSVFRTKGKPLIPNLHDPDILIIDFQVIIYKRMLPHDEPMETTFNPWKDVSGRSLHRGVDEGMRAKRYQVESNLPLPGRMVVSLKSYYGLGALFLVGEAAHPSAFFRRGLSLNILNGKPRTITINPA